MRLGQLDARAERAMDWMRLLPYGWFSIVGWQRAWTLAAPVWSDDGLGWAGRCAKAAPVVKRRRQKP